MEFTNKRTMLITASLVLLVAITQIIYTALYVAEVGFSRQVLWGLEALIFTVLVAFAGASMVQAKNCQIGWSAIAFSAAINIVQVSIGLTLFSSFGKVAGDVEGAQPLIGGVVALSFMIYYAAKLLLGLATPEGRNPSRPKVIKTPLASIATTPANAVSPPIALPPLAILAIPKTSAANPNNSFAA